MEYEVLEKKGERLLWTWRLSQSGIYSVYHRIITDYHIIIIITLLLLFQYYYSCNIE